MKYSVSIHCIFLISFFNVFYMTEKAESKRFSFDKEGLTSYCEFQKNSDIF